MSSETPQEQRDHWKAQAQEAWQNVAELRHWLVMSLYGPLGPESLETVRKLLERTKP